MEEFDSLVEQQTFDDLVEKEPVSSFHPEQTKVTSSLGQLDPIEPIKDQMQGPTASRFGMDFDPNMYLPDDLPDLSTLQEPGEEPMAREDVEEKTHHDFLISEEARAAIDAAQAKQPSIYQGPTSVDPPKIDPTLLQPSSTEYLMDKLSNESLIGKASIALTGVIQAGIHGGDPVDYYRDIYDSNQKTIMSYKPNQVQDMATGALAVTIDLPIFNGMGSVYNMASAGPIKAATSYVSDVLVRGGATRLMADKYAANSIMQLNAIMQSGSVLGTHAGLNDIATQIAQGTELDQINWHQASETGKHSFGLGSAIGAFGVGANYIKNAPGYQKLIDGSVKGRLIEKGFGAASFGGEVGVFTVGDVMLDEDKRMSDLKASDWAHAATTILALKSMHTKAPLPKSNGMFGAGEIDAMRSHVKDFNYKNPLESVVADPKALESIMKDPKVPYSVKYKLADVAGVKAEIPIVDRAEAIQDGNGFKVNTYAKDGTLIQSERFASKSDANRYMNSIEAGKAEGDKISESSTLKPEYQSELDSKVEKSGIDGGVSNPELIDAVQQLPSARTPAQKKLANKYFETYDNFIKEKTEVAEGEVAPEIFDKKAPESNPTIDPAEVSQAAEGRLAEIRAERTAADKGRVESLDALTRITGKEDFASAYRELDRMVEAKEGTMDEIGERRALRNKIKKDSGPQGLAEHVTPEGVEVTPIAKLKAERQEMIKGRPATGEATAASLKAAAERVRALKGTIGPKPGELGMSILPPKAYDLAFEVAAKTLETTADVTIAVGRAIDAIKTTQAYQNLSKREQQKVEDEIRRMLDAQVSTEKYSDFLTKLKKTQSEDYWSVDMPSEEVIDKAAKEGRLVDTGYGFGIVKENGDIVGVFKYDPNAKGEAKKIIDALVKKGGDRLDNFDGYLTKLYEEAGFEVVSRTPFDPKQAPKDMPAAEKAKKPDVVFMAKGDIPAEFLNQKFKSYEDAMAYRDAIMEDIAEGRPPKTAAQRKADKATGVTKPRKKIVVNEYTALKDQLKVGAKAAKDIDKFRKEAQAELQKVVGDKEFQSAMGARASRTIARKMAGVDVNNPNSIREAMEYIDKAIADVKFREELAEIDKTYNKIDKQTSPETMASKQNGVAKGKGMSVEAQDILNKTRKNMIEGDWKKAQEEINKLQEGLEQLKPEDPTPLDVLDRIEELNFHGLMNESSHHSLKELKSRLADIESIRKDGRTVGKARRMFEAEARKDRIQASFDVLNAGKRKAELDPEKIANLKTPLATQVSRWFDWSNNDSWFTLLDKMSRFDKKHGIFESPLSRLNSEPVFAAERGEFLGKEKVHNEVNAKAAEIFGEKNLKDVLDKNSSETHTMKWSDAEGKAHELPITQSQAYKRWMELQDPTLTPSLIKQGYFDTLGQKTAKYKALEATMTPEIKKWAEWQLNEFYPKYAETINEVYRDIYGTNMPIHDKYSPIFIADKVMSADAALDQMFNTTDVRGAAGNNHLKLRTNHAKELLMLDGDRVLMNYIDKMEFFKNWGRPLREMNQVFGDRGIRESIRQNFGQDYVDVVDHFLRQAAREPKKLNKFEKASNAVRKNFTVGSLAFKATVLTKQLTSFPAYADKIPVAHFAKGMADWANPAGWKKITETLNDSPYLRERYQKGWDRDVALAMQRDAQAMLAGKGGNNWTNHMMFLTKYGDKAAIMMGGWPVYKYHKNKALESGLSPEAAHEAGLRQFEFATRQSQQATGPMDLSVTQNSNPIMKWATMYKTSPLQYHRKVVTATRDLLVDGRSRKESLKTLVLYHAVLPQLFQLVSNGFQWDGEDQLRALKWGNLTGLPVAGDAIRGISNHITNTGFQYKPTVLTDLFGETTKAYDEINAMISGDVDFTFDDIWEGINHISKSAGSWTGTPADAVQNTVSGISDAIQGETDYPVRRILGWSEYALDKDRYDLTRGMPSGAQKKVKKNLDNEKVSWDELIEGQGGATSFDDLIED